MTYSSEEFLKIVAKRKPNIEIIDEIPKRSEIPFKCKCKICGNYVYKTKRYLLHYKGKGCAICDGKEVVKGYNDMKTTAPDIARYYSEQFATTHTHSSSIEGLAKCPICGTEKMISPCTINRQGFGCLKCSDGISYPNKYFRAFITQFDLDVVKFEYSPEWVGKRYYDNYFEYKGDKYIVEVDGGLGHTGKMYHNYVGLEAIIRDCEKNNMAIAHGISVIRIDARISDGDYLKNSISKSELANILDLSKVDWDKCSRRALKNIVYEVCKEYDENTEIGVEDLAVKYCVSPSAITQYLKKGAKLNICSYTRKDVWRRRCITLSRKYGRKVSVKDEVGNFIGVYDSVKICARELHKLYPNIEFKLKSINNSIYNNKKYKGFTITLCEKEVNYGVS